MTEIQVFKAFEILYNSVRDQVYMDLNENIVLTFSSCTLFSQKVYYDHFLPICNNDDQVQVLELLHSFTSSPVLEKSLTS